LQRLSDLPRREHDIVQILAEGRHQQTHIGIVVNLKDLDFVDVCFFHFHW